MRLKALLVLSLLAPPLLSQEIVGVSNNRAWVYWKELPPLRPGEVLQLLQGEKVTGEVQVETVEEQTASVRLLSGGPLQTGGRVKRREKPKETAGEKKEEPRKEKSKSEQNEKEGEGKSSQEAPKEKEGAPPLPQETSPKLTCAEVKELLQPFCRAPALTPEGHLACPCSEQGEGGVLNSWHLGKSLSSKSPKEGWVQLDGCPQKESRIYFVEEGEKGWQRTLSLSQNLCYAVEKRGLFCLGSQKGEEGTWTILTFTAFFGGKKTTKHLFAALDNRGQDSPYHQLLRFVEWREEDVNGDGALDFIVDLTTTLRGNKSHKNLPPACRYLIRRRSFRLTFLRAQETYRPSPETVQALQLFAEPPKSCPPPELEGKTSEKLSWNAPLDAYPSFSDAPISLRSNFTSRVFPKKSCRAKR